MTATSPTDVLRARLLATFFGRPGWILVLQGEFDETGTHKGSPLICVAGYLFEGSGAVDFSGRFEALKKQPEFSIPDTTVFSAADVMRRNRKKPPFDQWPRTTRDAFMIGWAEAIAATAHLGVVAVVDKPAFDRLFSTKPGLLSRVGSQYTLALMAAVNLVRVKLDEVKDERLVDYNFESRDRKADSEPHSLLVQIASQPELQQRFRYAGHTFRTKSTHLPLYAADLLAWEWQHFIMADDPDRASLHILLNGVKHVHMRYGDIKIAIQLVVNDFYGLRPLTATSRREERRSRRTPPPS
jgi:hypothetical protein